MKKTGKNFICLTCGTEFYRSAWQIKRNKQKFCSLTCRRHTKVAIKKMSILKKGKKPWNYGLNKLIEPRLNFFRPTTFKNQGKSSLHTKIRKSVEMKVWRESVFKRDNYQCVECKQVGGRLNADHIKPFALFPELRFEISNGRTLCEDCHRKTDTFGIKTARLINKVGSLNFS